MTRTQQTQERAGEPSRMSISRLTLGAAQLGLNYGIANMVGKPARAASLEILEAAVRGGITCIDTAPVYGDSEEVIGSFLRRRSNCPECTVITKLPRLALRPEASFTDVHHAVRKHVTTSIERLQVRRLPIYLLHHAGDLDSYGSKVVASLVQLKEEGLIGMLGVSVYTPAEVELVLAIDVLEAIQVPISIFDQRLLRLGLLERLRERKRIVFARSVFLQGLFFLPASRLPYALQRAAGPLAELKELCSEHNRGIAQVALAFVRDLPGVTSVVVGAETTDQLTENLTLMQSPPLSPALHDQVIARFADLPPELTSPNMWHLADREGS